MKNRSFILSKQVVLSYIIWTTCLSSFSQSDSLANRLDRYKKSQAFDSALSVLNEMLIQTEIEASDTAKANIYLEMGVILCRLHRCEQGKDLFIKALSIGKNSNKPKLAGNALMSIGNYFLLFQNKYDSAFKYYQESLTWFGESGHTKEILAVRSNIAYLHLQKGEIERAKTEYEKILQFHLATNDSSLISIEYFNLARTYNNLNHYQEALTNIQLANDFSRDNLQRARIARELGKIYLELEDYKNSALAMLAYDSLIGDHVNRDYASELSELAERFKTAEIERDNALKQAEIEENRRQLFILYAFSFLLILASVSTYLFFNQRRKRQKLASEKAIQDLLQEQEIKTTYALLQGQDKERKRVAEELHDSLGSILVTLNMYADSLNEKNPKEMPELAKKISKTANLANEETRRISHNLYSGMLQHFGLEAAILQLSEAVTESKQIAYEIEVNLENPLSTEVSLEVYRVIQELTNNSLKHSDCTKIRLEINYLKDSLTIIYEDNGRGFNKNEIVHGLGLQNIASRINKLDGDLTVDSTPGRGSTFIIEISQL